MPRKRLNASDEKPEKVPMRANNLELPEDLDIKLLVYARRHKMSRGQAFAIAVKKLTAGMRIGYGTDEGEEGEAA
jgi:hypothetical protein